MDWARPIDTPTMVPTITMSSQSGKAAFAVDEVMRHIS